MVRPAIAMMILTIAAAGLAALAAEPATRPATAPASLPADPDPALTAATARVESSDRYLHHSRLRAGMTGYGLTVMSGTVPVRFDVEILAVMSRWSAHQDVILARLSGPQVERTGVAAGMSGSPVYVRDDRDGRDKLIGAVAYAFYASKEPICGIQPITQMLTVQQRAARPESPAAVEAGASDRASRAMLAAALDPHRTDLPQLLWQACAERLQPASASGGLAPLATPLMITGLSDRTLRQMRDGLTAAGLLPVQAGTASSASSDQPPAPLVPGGVLSVVVMTGDIDLSAIGTVTDVDGDRLLAFGHAFLAEGDAEFPIGPGYVHTVVPSLLTSFKLASGGPVTGALVRDEQVGVLGLIGRPATLIPMTVSVDWPDRSIHQTFRFGLARHRLLTPLAALVGLTESVQSWRELPELHTVRHSMTVDFGDLGTYQAVNVAAGAGLGQATADLIRPLVTLLDNPLGPPAAVRSIDVQVTVESADRSAEIVDLKLDGRFYRPGETVTGSVTLKPFRQARCTVPVRLDLPADLPDGTYTLTACDGLTATDDMITEMPQRFDPRTVPELLAALKRLNECPGDRLYLRLPRDEQHLAVGTSELPDLPDSRKDILSQAALPADATSFIRSQVTSVPSRYVLMGSASAEFDVQQDPTMTPTRP